MAESQPVRDNGSGSPKANDEHAPPLMLHQGLGGGLASRRILVTGGCGFIGSAFVRECLSRGTRSPVIVVMDSLTYAGSLANLEPVRGYTFIPADIRSDIALGLIKDFKLNTVVHFAAETHVDRSILESRRFFDTNVIGTINLLNAVREVPGVEFIHVSTDEVYGDAELRPRLDELTCLAPSSPYAVSKAAADMAVQAYARTYGLKVKIVRPCNAFGPYQFPEKLIPLTISNLLHGEPIRLYGDGLQRRDWVYVEDLCDQILLVLERGAMGGVFNLGEPNNVANLDIVHEVFRYLSELERIGGTWDAHVQFTDDRPGHDRAYGSSYSKLRLMGHEWENRFVQQLRSTIDWYMSANDWLRGIRGRPEYQEWMTRG